MGFVTPVALAPKRSSTFVSGISNGGNVSTGASKAKSVNFVDLEFMSELERVEAEIKSGSKFVKDDALKASGGGEGSRSGSKCVEGEVHIGSSAEE